MALPRRPGAHGSAEDEIAIALEFEAALRDAGFDVVGPALNAVQATELASGQTFNVAVVLSRTCRGE
jgi:hypothetical protein